MGLEPDVKSDSFISDELAAAALLTNTVLKSNSKSAVLPNGLIFSMRYKEHQNDINVMLFYVIEIKLLLLNNNYIH